MKMKLFILLLIAVTANKVSAVASKTDEGKDVITRVYNLSMSLTDFEKDALKHTIGQLKNVEQKLRQQINSTDSDANRKIEEIQKNNEENFDETVKNIKDPKCVSELLRSEIAEAVTKAKEEYKKCMGKAYKEEKHNHDRAKKHIDLARLYMGEVKDALKYCNGTEPNSSNANEVTECITKRFQTLKDFIGSEILEVRERVRVAMEQIPTIMRSYHHCNKKALKAAKRKLDDFRRKVHHCLKLK